MATACIAQSTLRVHGISKPIIARFDQPHASSDGGALLLKAPHGIRPRRGFMSTTLLEVPVGQQSRDDPVSGRSILFVNPMHTHGFVGMKREAAWPLIEELAVHATQERFVYYHRWRVGDVLIWDERATMHRGAGDYRPDERRIMLRTIVYPN